MAHQGNRMSKVFDSSYLPESTSLYLAEPFQPIDVSSDAHMLQLRLKDSFLTGLHFNSLDSSDVQVSYFSCLVSSDVPLSDVAATNEEEILTFEHVASTNTTHPQVFINRPILSEVKLKMLQAGIKAEMVAGVLVCEDKIIVKKVLNFLL